LGEGKGDEPPQLKFLATPLQKVQLNQTGMKVAVTCVKN